MKIFVLSLHRTGTNSVSKHLRGLGIPTNHFPSVDNGVEIQPRIVGRETDLNFVLESITPAFEGYSAASDVPIPVLYKQLHARYADARFILATRDPGDWVRSVRRRKSGREFRPFERVQYWHYFPTCPAGLDEIADNELIGMTHRHTAAVNEYFAKCHPSKLGVFDLYDDNCGPAITSFLGMEGGLSLPGRKKPKRFQKLRDARKHLGKWLSA